jgi:integrase/recombinase XerD
MTLSDALEDYLAQRKALGFKLRLATRLLRRFVDFLDREEAEVLTVKMALDWAQQPPEAQPATWAGKLTMIRGFATYLHALDPRTEVPPLGLIATRFRRRKPFIYTEKQIRDLIEQARHLPSASGLRVTVHRAGRREGGDFFEKEAVTASIM